MPMPCPRFMPRFIDPSFHQQPCVTQINCLTGAIIARHILRRLYLNNQLYNPPQNIICGPREEQDGYPSWGIPPPSQRSNPPKPLSSTPSTVYISHSSASTSYPSLERYKSIWRFGKAIGLHQLSSFLLS